MLSNRKEERRKGKVQLIDATAIKTPLRKNLGEKNCETNEENRAEIMKLFMDFTETSQSKIFPNEEFGYYNVTVERPLRLRVIPNADVDGAINLKAAEKERVKKAMENVSEDVPLNDWNQYAKALKLPKGLLKKLQTIIAERDETAVAVEDTPDPLLRDVEQVPLRYPGGIDAFMQKEVLPYAPDAYYELEK